MSFVSATLAVSVEDDEWLEIRCGVVRECDVVVFVVVVLVEPLYR